MNEVDYSLQEAQGAALKDGRKVESRPYGRRRVILMALGRYNAQVHEGLANWVRQNDWELDAEAFPIMVRRPAANCDGVVTSIATLEHLEWLSSYNCPVVRVLQSQSEEIEAACRHVPMVGCDIESTGRIGAEHLLSLGQPHFAFYHQTWGRDVLALRQSFVSALQGVGREATVLAVQPEYQSLSRGERDSREFHRCWLEGKLRVLPKPLAVMCEDDRSAVDLMHAVRCAGLRVPDDVAILGVNDDRLFHEVSPIPISSVDTGLVSVGYIAASLVGRLADGGDMPTSPFLVQSCRVFERESTSTYSGTHKGVIAAMLYIRRHFREPLKAARVAEHAGMSLRSLQDVLRQNRQPTIQHEIIRLRIAAAKEMLEKTDLELEAIAIGAGLHDAKHLCRVFRQYCRLTPLQWRDLRTTQRFRCNV